jgi:hypothetical protein
LTVDTRLIPRSDCETQPASTASEEDSVLTPSDAIDAGAGYPLDLMSIDELDSTAAEAEYACERDTCDERGSSATTAPSENGSTIAGASAPYPLESMKARQCRTTQGDPRARTDET